MLDYRIRHFAPGDIEQVRVLQQAYADIYPGAPVIPGEVYLSPGFDGGRTLALADWQYFLSSPAWATGTTFTARVGPSRLQGGTHA